MNLAGPNFLARTCFTRHKNRTTNRSSSLSVLSNSTYRWVATENPFLARNSIIERISSGRNSYRRFLHENLRKRWTYAVHVVAYQSSVSLPLAVTSFKSLVHPDLHTSIHDASYPSHSNRREGYCNHFFCLPPFLPAFPKPTGQLPLVARFPEASARRYRQLNIDA